MKRKNFISMLKHLSENLLNHIFIGYLEFVDKTSSIRINSKDLITKDQMIGYWHGDSYPMQLILKHISKPSKNINVIVTADTRGNYIEKILNHYDAIAIRLPDGFHMKPFLKHLKIESQKENLILACALDGPIGPLHEAKKLLFLLSKESNKPLLYFHFKYSAAIRLTKRWDNYVIPLPFTKITATVEELGVITPEYLREFHNKKHELIF